jgi:Flp pilus assembly pilin Flp
MHGSFKSKNRLVNEERGQDLIEYALLGAVIALACTATMQSIASSIVSIFGTLSGSI